MKLSTATLSREKPPNILYIRVENKTTLNLKTKVLTKYEKAEKY